MIREQYPFFQLDTEHTSYCFRVTETGHLEHLHYGRKITSGENLTESLAIFAEKHAFAPGNTNVYDKEHPEFSLEEFRKKSENSLNAFLSALETQELSSLAGISESLRNQARLRIDDQDRQGIREQFRNVKIHQTAISRYEKRPGCCAVTFQSAVEYVYGRTRNGEKEVMPDRIQTRYDMEWIYIQDPERYGQAAGGAVGVSCPNCGAPVTQLGSHKCEYCGGVVEPVNIRCWQYQHFREVV